MPVSDPLKAFEKMTHSPTGWAVSCERIAYPDALAAMEARAEAIARGEASELIWLLEHDPLYTAGTSAKDDDLKDRHRFPVFKAGRGGEFTYHGPGQRVAYVMLDLRVRGRDVRAFVKNLEEWIIRTLEPYNITGERRCNRVGVWVDRSEVGGPEREDKIAAIGIRLRKWVSFHGIALNVEPYLSHFGGITPCGISDPRYGVTSLVDLGHPVTMDEVDHTMRRAFESVFGETRDEAAPL